MSSELQNYNNNRNLSKWAMQVEKCRNSGMTVKDWCKKNNLSLSTYYIHQKKVYMAIKEQESSADFYEVGTQMPIARNEPVASLQYNDYRAEIYSGADEETIVSILKAVKRC